MFLTTQTELMLAAAGDLAGIGSAVAAGNSAAATPTSSVVPPAVDEVSMYTAAHMTAQAQAYQAISAHAAVIHQQFVEALTTSANSYLTTEIANALSAK